MMAKVTPLIVPIHFSWKSTIIFSACLFLIGGGAGLSGGWLLWHPERAIFEAHKPEKVKADGSVVLERQPSPGMPAPHAIDAGFTVDRIVKVTVAPKPVRDTVRRNDTVWITDTCPPVTVVLTVNRHPTGGTRVQASSPDGRILSGVDIPTAMPPEAAKPRKWAAGVIGSVQPLSSAWAVGAFIDRDFGPFRLGAEAMGGKWWSAGLRIGVKF